MDVSLRWCVAPVVMWVTVEMCAGNLNSNGNDLLVYGKQFGNVFIGVQPTFGYEGDPMRLLFSRSASPHHGFAAYYTFLERVFQADAVLHFGTHGRWAGIFRGSSPTLAARNAFPSASIWHKSRLMGRIIQ